MAAVLACGPNAVLSHGSALTLWGIWKRWGQAFDVTVAVDRRPKGIRVHRTNNLDRREMTRHYGIPVTTLARTLLDMAPAMRPKSINRAVNNGRLEHGLRLDDLIESDREKDAERWPSGWPRFVSPTSGTEVARRGGGAPAPDPRAATH